MVVGRTALALTVATAAVSAFDPRYYVDEWDGICKTGKFQTPINLPAYDLVKEAVPAKLVTDVTSFPTAKGMSLSNVGIGMKFQWKDVVGDLPVVKAGGHNISHVLLDSSVPVDLELKVKPIQFHVHSMSEHAVDGLYYPAEAHIVSLVDRGQAPPEWGCDAVWEGGDPVLENCTAVFGVLFKVGKTSPTWLERAYDEGPRTVGEKKEFSLKDVHLDDILPKDHSYFTYIGSLTTRPCNEGLRWHVFKNPISITELTLQKMEDFMQFSKDPDSDAILGYRMNHRYLQDRAGRTIWTYEDKSTSCKGECTRQWGNCLHTKSCCGENQCIKKNDYYAQCRPADKPPSKKEDWEYSILTC